jgi:hypothetical protein
MAAGAPVIAMPISSVPEVGGDAVLYPEGLSADALARAMGHLAMDKRLRESLQERGRLRVAQFNWGRTASRTFEVYRSAVMHPSARSLGMRRRLREAILNWSNPVLHEASAELAYYHPTVEAHPPGIRTAWKALNLAVHRRLRREMRRVNKVSGRKSA